MPRVSVSGEPSAGGSQWTQLYLGLGFTTLATVLLELSLTRIFAVVFFDAFGFAAISLALLGLGAGGVFAYVIASRPGKLSTELGRLTFINSVAVVLLLWFILSRHGESSLGALAVVCAAAGVPFFFAGTVVSLAISEAIGRIDRAYLFDLTGAATACLLVGPFLSYFGGANTAIAAGVIYAVAASIWFNRAGEAALRASAVLVALVLVTLMIMNGANRVFDVRWANGAHLPEERMSKWNSFSRVGLEKASGGADAPWEVRIDGRLAFRVSDVDLSKPLSEARGRDLLDRGAGLAYLMRPGAKTLVVGMGGGVAVARALASGAKNVTATEVNPIVANDVPRGAALDSGGRPYGRPNVQIAVEDGRSFVRASRERYDVMEVTFADVRAATSLGILAMGANRLFTTEAFGDYLTHLTGHGLLTVTASGDAQGSQTALRVVSLAVQALLAAKENDVAAHIIVVRDPSGSDGNPVETVLETVLISRAPFAAEEVRLVERVARERGMEILYHPRVAPRNAFVDLLATANPGGFWSTYSADVSPVYDDRPFFFYTRRGPESAHSSEAPSEGPNQAMPMLHGLFAVCIAAIVVLMFLPGLALPAHLPQQKGIPLFLTYFLCLGAGYVLIQAALVQKLAILLGQPGRELTVIVFSMIAASGFGSWASRRMVGDGDRRLIQVLAAVAMLIAVVAATSPSLVRAAAAWPEGGRIALVVALIAPVAFLIGMPFPSGLRRLEQRQASAIRWAWSLNAAAGVAGSTGAVLIAAHVGWSAALLSGGALYLVALAVILATPREKHAL